MKAALVSLLILGSVCGCAAQPQGMRNPGTTVGQAAGADAGTTLPGGTAADPMANRVRARIRRDLGQQISDTVARALGGRFIGMGTTWGRTAGAKPIGVSTLVIGDMAFVGLDTTTLPAGWTRAGQAGVTGTAAGTAAGGTAGMQRRTAGGTPVGTDRNGTGAGGTVTATRTTLEDRIRTQVRAAFPQVTEVYVTTDPALVTRIARAARSIQTGRATTTQLDEILAIAKAMVGR